MDKENKRTHKDTSSPSLSTGGGQGGGSSVYFLSDAHLGSWAIDNRLEQERRLVNFLDRIKHDAQAVYLLGDMFDFWYEFRYVVPRGYSRFLGKLSELTDMGVEVHYFTGNHDIWAFDYLATECGVTLHHEPETRQIMGKTFYLAHGDGLGDPDKMFRFIRSIFHSKTCQWLFSLLPTRWSMWFGQTWAKHSRMKRPDGKEEPYLGEDKEFQVQFAKQYMKEHEDVDYFVFGHRHIELDLMLSRKTRLLILGDWIWQFTYAVFDGEIMYMDNEDI